MNVLQTSYEPLTSFLPTFKTIFMNFLQTALKLIEGAANKQGAHRGRGSRKIAKLLLNSLREWQANREHIEVEGAAR
jgi:hypothetical protein